jgi:hypothetical protein
MDEGKPRKTAHKLTLSFAIAIFADGRRNEWWKKKVSAETFS